jgi:hypothetical protein
LGNSSLFGGLVSTGPGLHRCCLFACAALEGPHVSHTHQPPAPTSEPERAALERNELPLRFLPTWPKGALDSALHRLQRSPGEQTSDLYLWSLAQPPVQANKHALLVPHCLHFQVSTPILISHGGPDYFHLYQMASYMGTWVRELSSQFGSAGLLQRPGQGGGSLERHEEVVASEGGSAVHR